VNPSVSVRQNPKELFVTEAMPPITFGTMRDFAFAQNKVIDQQSDEVGRESQSELNAAVVQSEPIAAVQVNVAHITEEEAQQDFEKMIDDMAFKVWACGRCLHMGHQTKDCENDIRCRACFSYGHIKRNCFGQNKRKKQWVPKLVDSTSNKGPESLFTSADSSSPRKQIKSSSQTSFNPTPPPISSSPESMVVFEVDPLPWLPWGHQVIDGGPTRLPRTYYFPVHDPPSEHLDPPPPPQAAALWREQVHDFLVGPLQRNVVSIQASLFGVGLFSIEWAKFSKRASSTWTISAAEQWS
jgi:hypothetical protein